MDRRAPIAVAVLAWVGCARVSYGSLDGDPGPGGDPTAAAGDVAGQGGDDAGAPGCAGAVTWDAVGLGTAMAPYLLCEPAQLRSLAGLSGVALGGSWLRLEADFELGGVAWVPVASTADPFQGTFDGAGHRITGLTVAANDAAGLFAAVGAAGRVVQLRLDAVEIVSVNGPAGAVAGVCNGEISDTAAGGAGLTAPDITAANEVGGIVGRLEGGALLRLSAHIHVAADNDVGGLAGGVLGGRVEDCVAAGAVDGLQAGSAELGGLVGVASGGDLQRVAASGAVTGGSAGSWAVGGLIGYIASPATLLDAYATGDVAVGDPVGGLVGFVEEPADIRNVYATGRVTADGRGGGLLGEPWGVDLARDCFALGDVSGSSAGQLVGQDATAVVGCYYDANSVLSAGAVARIAGQAVDVGGADPIDYFFVPTSPPMDAWDFALVWEARPGAPPVLRSALP